jgi:hypothetical protein
MTSKVAQMTECAVRAVRLSHCAFHYAWNGFAILRAKTN